LLSKEQWLKDPGVREDHKGALCFFAGGRLIGPPLEPPGPDGGIEGGDTLLM